MLALIIPNINSFRMIKLLVVAVSVVTDFTEIQVLSEWECVLSEAAGTDVYFRFKCLFYLTPLLVRSQENITE